jgi:hypothetical protein
VNSAQEPWTKIPAGSPWTNPGEQNEARQSRGVLALQGTAPHRGHSKIKDSDGTKLKGGTMRRQGTGDGLVMTDRMTVSWSSVVTRVEHGEVKLGRKMEPVEGGGPHGCFI